MATTKKTTRKTTPTQATAAAPRPSTATPRRPAAGATVTQADRQRMIAENAYFRAEGRGFNGGNPVADWLAAEAEINARF